MIAILAAELKLAPGSTAGYSVERIDQNADLMNDLIGGLLEHSALRNVLEAVERVDLGSAVESALGGLETEIEARHASVECTDGFPLVMAHRRTLVQAISNLIDNALKFVAAGVVPHIAIACAARGGRARLTIHDNGIGIEPENHERIFGVFERLHPPGPYPGTGIGLAIVRRAVEQMGGSVGVDSSVKAGSTFWIELPMASRATTSSGSRPRFPHRLILRDANGVQAL
jgi:signal transduction histidine kinase